MGKLSATAVKAATRPGRIGDGDGLYLVVKPSGTKSLHVARPEAVVCSEHVASSLSERAVWDSCMVTARPVRSTAVAPALSRSA